MPGADGSGHDFPPKTPDKGKEKPAAKREKIIVHRDRKTEMPRARKGASAEEKAEIARRRAALDARRPKKIGILEPAYQANADMLLGRDPTLQPHKMKVGAGILDPGYQKALQKNWKRGEKRAAKKDEPFVGRGLNSPLKRLLISAFALFGGLNVIDGANQTFNNRPLSDAERAQRDRDQAERERASAERRAAEWNVRAEKTSVWSAEGSPFESLFDENGSITVPNFYLGLPDRSLFSSVTVSRGESVTGRGPALLRRLWDMKCEITDNDEGVVALADQRVGAYERAVGEGRLTRSSLDLEMARAAGFERDGIAYTDAIAANINWRAYGVSEGLSEDQTNLLRRIAAHIDPAMIEAIFLTELTPQMELPRSESERDTRNPERQARINVALYDYMFRTYGEEFINNFPAMDQMISLGAGQPTRYVFGPHSSTGRVNRFLDPSVYALLSLPDGQGGYRTTIADNAADYRSHEEQQVVAYLNAIYNLSFLIANSSGAREGFENILATLENGTEEEKQLALEHLAESFLAHNNPGEATEAFGQWGRQSDLDAPVGRFADERNHREYATSLRFNYRALRQAYRHVFERAIGPTVTLPSDTDGRWTEIRRRVRSQAG